VADLFEVMAPTGLGHVSWRPVRQKIAGDSAAPTTMYSPLAEDRGDGGQAAGLLDSGMGSHETSSSISTRLPMRDPPHKGYCLCCWISP